jgi:hypothetical protein
MNLLNNIALYVLFAVFAKKSPFSKIGPLNIAKLRFSQKWREGREGTYIPILKK